MLFENKSLEQNVKEMKAFGAFLMPYNFPKVSPECEDDVGFIKSRELTVDGYNVVVYYSKADWTEHYLEILQITGRHIPFMPFSLVCKIGKIFLGDRELSYVDFIKDGRKVYCWTVVLDLNNLPIINPYKVDVSDCSYEGFCYRCLNPAKVNFY